MAGSAVEVGARVSKQVGQGSDEMFETFPERAWRWRQQRLALAERLVRRQQTVLWPLALAEQRQQFVWLAQQQHAPS